MQEFDKELGIGLHAAEMLEVRRSDRDAVVKFRLISIRSEDNWQSHSCLLVED